MTEVSQAMTEIISTPFLVVSLVVVALGTAIRKTFHIMRPEWEKKKWYKALLAWLPLILGILAALAAKGMGQFEASWGYVVLLGVLAGFFSSWLWNALKPAMKLWMKLEDGDKK